MRQRPVDLIRFLDYTPLVDHRTPGRIGDDSGKRDMTPDHQRWSEALAIERQHGTDACRWVAERIGALALAGDQAGVERFKEIAAKLDELLRAGRA